MCGVPSGIVMKVLKMWNRRILLWATLMLAFAPLPLRAQFYSFGTEPSSVEWRQIRSEHFKLIYPAETDSLARTYLMRLEQLRPLANDPVRIDTKPIPVIIHAYTTLSNGSVSWAPKQLNLIPSPNPYDCTQNPWQEQLVIHELRHVAQTQHFTKGLWRALYWGLGQQSTGIGMGLFASTKYLEGDAVVTETEFTRSGRGRSAEFLMPLRTDYLQGRYLNWERSALGSFFKNTYDPYALGYLLVTSERMRTGDADFIGRFYQNKAALSDIKCIFTNPEKNYYYSRSKNLADAQQRYTRIWQEDAERRGTPTEGWRLSKPQRRYCDYWGAVQVTDSLSPMFGSLVVLRKGLSFTEELLQIDTLGRERHIRFHAPYSSKLSEAVDGKIYWSESVMHDPSSLENFSEIKYYDTRRDLLGTLTRDTKYFNPAVSDDGRLLAVAEYPVGEPSHVLLLDAADGRVLTRVEAPGKGQVYELMFVGQWLYVTLGSERGLSLLRIRHGELEAGQWQTIIPAQQASISGLRHLKGQWICFASDHDGVLNIYALHPVNNQIFRLTNSRYGANYPFLDENHQVLYFSEYDSDGYHLVSMNFRELCWKKSDFSQRQDDPILQQILAQDAAAGFTPAAVNPDYLDEEKYPSKPYTKLLNAFHIHSWAPFYYNVDRIMSFSPDTWYEAVLPGATVYSQNELGDAVTMLGWSWWGRHAGHAKVTATVADFDVEVYGDVNNLRMENNGSQTYHNDIGVSLDYPFNLYGGGWYRMLVPTLGLSWEKENVPTGEWQRCISLGMRYYRMLPVAKSAIYPRWGFSVSSNLQLFTQSESEFAEALLSCYTYLPGLTRSQGLRLSLVGQSRLSDRGDPSLALGLSLPRGYGRLSTGEQYLKGSADYAIPVPLGDVAIPGFLYFKRLQLIPFGDYALDFLRTGRQSYWSAGVSALVDFHVLRMAPNLTAGVRWSYTGPQPGGANRNSVNMLFNIAL